MPLIYWLPFASNKVGHTAQNALMLIRSTPCLVPYEQLPEEEKVYDRNTSMETLKFIMGKGFHIVKENEF